MNRDDPLPAGAESEPSGHDGAFERIYSRLRLQARRQLAKEKQGHTLQATALVHEVYLRLQQSNDPSTADSGRFYGAAALAMRRILIEHARAKGRQRRGGDARKLPLDAVVLATSGNIDDVMAVDDAICRLEEQDPEAAEIVRLRFYAGLSVEETAQALGRSVRTVHREWSYARAWLQRRLSPDSS